MASFDNAALSSVTSDSASRPENDPVGQKAAARGNVESKRGEATLAAFDNAATIPKGTLDPVYEAKARVLNHAVCLKIDIWGKTNTWVDPRHWYGMVSMAALHRSGIWLGK